MHITLHTGAGGSYGLGHACRMRALATALTAQGATVAFLTSTPALVDFVAPLPCTLAPHAWPAYSTSCDVLVEDVLPTATSSPWWYSRLREHMRVVRVDAPTATPQTCDVLLAPVAHWDPAVVTRLDGAFGSRFLYGWDYVLLEQEVVQTPRVPSDDRLDGPLVFAAGGSDPGHHLAQLALWMGESVKTREWIALVPTYGGPHVLPVWIRALPFDRAWIRQAAVLVTTFGVTCYEAIWWGIPAVLVGMTAGMGDDAVRLMHASRGAVLAVWPPEPRFPDSLGQLITSLLEQRVEQQRMMTASAGLLDGQGANRAALAILTLTTEKQ